MEVFLHSNSNEVKVYWHYSEPGSAYSKPYLVDASALRECCTGVRTALTSLNEYVRGNPNLTDDLDPQWKAYHRILSELRMHGALLRAALIGAGEPEDAATLFDQRLHALEADVPITFHCSDQGVTIPLGFVFDGHPSVTTAKPSKSDFDGFWINRFKLGIRLSGTDCRTSTPIDTEQFNALYALNKEETGKVMAEFAEAERKKFALLTSIALRDHYNWDQVGQACLKLQQSHAVFFVFAHSDGRTLRLADADNISWEKLRSILQRRIDAPGHNTDAARKIDPVGLVILNCCASAAGATGKSLLSSVTQPGFCGLIGTESEIANVAAMRCGLHLMWNLCVKGMKLGDAFFDMQNLQDLFPLNLLYTFYAARDFQLRQPVQFATALEVT